MTTPLPPGWYPDPSGKPEKLYWDGHQWYTAPPPAPPTVEESSSAALLEWPGGGAPAAAATPPPEESPPPTFVHKHEPLFSFDRDKSTPFKKGMKVRVASAGDESDGRVGTFHQYLHDDGDGMTIGVLFKGDSRIYAFSPREIQTESLPPKPGAATTPTPAPTSTAQCFKCNHRQIVPKSTTRWACEQCGQKLKRAVSAKKPPQYSSGPMGTFRADSAGAFGSNVDKNVAVAIGVCVLVAIGFAMSMQSASVMSGSGPIWTGVGFVAAGTAVAFFMRAAAWVRVVAAVCLALVLLNAFYMEKQLEDKRNEISQIFGN